MSQSYSHQPLGQLVRPVDVRNKELKVDRLLGVSVNKCFIPSVANTIGTDMSKYKIVRKGQFVYVPVTSRNGDKITVALLDEGACIVSQAYTVFEVVDEKQLCPEYLMLWFSRPEFDRYARFYSHGSAREVFDWETLCETQIPLPPIDVQRQIVEQFRMLDSRMALCREKISLLERAATALYCKTFVEGIDRNNLPNGWRWGTLGEVGNVSSGKTISDKQDAKSTEYCIPVVGASGIIGYSKSANQTERLLTTGRVGTIGVVKKYHDKVWTADNVLVLKSQYYEYCYQYLCDFRYEDIMQGGVQSLITQTHLSNAETLIPSEKDLGIFERDASILGGSILSLEAQIACLEKMKQLLLTQIK